MNIQVRDLKEAFELLIAQLEKSRNSVQELEEREALIRTCLNTVAILKDA